MVLCTGGGLELVDSVATVAAGANDLRGVEALLADVVQRVVEQTGQLAQGFCLEVVLLVLLLALLGLILKPVQPGVDGALKVAHPLGRLLLDDIETSREVGSAKSTKSQQEKTRQDALQEDMVVTSKSFAHCLSSKFQLTGRRRAASVCP